MTLTPEEVHKKTFTPVRLREGYDMGEVDQFLDEVEVELTRLHDENDKLRAGLADPSAVSASSSSADEVAAEPRAVAQPATTIAEASGAAARLLEIAAQNADQLVSEARGDADKILGEATIKAERLDTESKANAESLEAEVGARAEQQDAELAARRLELLGGLERDKETLASELEDLRSFEREYRSRLRAYFESQLRMLDGEDGKVTSLPTPQDADSATGEDSAAGATEAESSGRLQQLLGENPDN